jgi:hypothetical protein
VYSKRPFAGPQQVLAYLSRYTHRVGISNRRLLQLDIPGGALTFDYKDYADGARHKTMKLPLGEFIRRLCLHFLPAGFVKIRHYGLLANRGRLSRLAGARALLGVPAAPASPQPSRLHSGAARDRAPSAKPQLPRCPRCGWAALFLVRVIGPQRFQRSVSPHDSS